MHQTNAAAQPIGVFPFPAGLLLLGESPEDDEAVRDARDSLLQGRLPKTWPAALHAHQLAHQGYLEAAAEEFLAEEDAYSAFNHFVLAPEGVDAGALRSALPSHLAPLVDAVLYTLGDVDDLPEDTSSAVEVEAFLASVRATIALSAGEPGLAVALLHDAAQTVADLSPALSAILIGNAGSILFELSLDPAMAYDDLRLACLGLNDTDLYVARAELHLHLGLLIHAAAAAGQRPLSEAVHEYYSALQLVDLDAAPYTWASAHLNLGAAYLTMPMVEATDQLRSGIAMQSLRAALGVFTKEDHPAEWASATLNLANALVYTPSTHQGDNIVEAVERYEEVLATRDRERDPLGRARILANLGNALAHLGIFDHAKSRLYEARYLFEEALDHDSVMMVRSILDEISRETVPDSGRVTHALPARIPVPAIDDPEEVGS